MKFISSLSNIIHTILTWICYLYFFLASIQPYKNIYKLEIKIQFLSHLHFMENRWGNNGNSDRLFFLGLQNHSGQWLQPWNWKTLAPWKKSYDQLRQHIKKQIYHFADKDPSSQKDGFSSSCVWMWGLDHKESWVLKNWCFFCLLCWVHF